MKRHLILAAAISLLPHLASAQSTPIPQPTADQLAAAGLSQYPLAPLAQRVDLAAPPFTNSTTINNPLFPISQLHSAVLNGKVDGQAFRVETQLLPETQIIEWPPGQQIRVLVSQYLAFSNGRIEEVAIDLYAQADDGSVWYLGEDVYNYVDGVVEDTLGTWRAGKDGPAAMIMPDSPAVGDAFWPENIVGLVFEEVVVTEVNQTVAGPRGPVTGAIVTRELHADGTTESKTFAPGYGEFSTGSGANVEAIAVAIPADALTVPLPADLDLILNRGDAMFDTIGSRSWTATSASLREANGAWTRLQATGTVPPRLVEPVTTALSQLGRAARTKDYRRGMQAALALQQAGLDILLQYRSVLEINLNRFSLWLDQVELDARYRNARGLRGDASTLEWLRDRVVPSFHPTHRTRVDTLLVALRVAANDENFRACARIANDLDEALEVAAVRLPFGLPIAEPSNP